MTTTNVSLETLTGREAIELESLVGQSLDGVIEQANAGTQSVKIVLAIAFITAKREDDSLVWEEFIDGDLETILTSVFEVEDAPKAEAQESAL